MRPVAPLPDADEARDNATFDAILGALARPGTVHRLPEAGEATIVQALIDRECRVWTADTALGEVVRRTGATLTPPELAGHVFLPLATEADLDRVARLSPGDPLYPDEGTTVVTRATIGDGQELRLTGPGIETEARLRLGGIHPAFWTVRTGLCRYPLGIELLVLDGDRLVAIPRSTTVEDG